MENEKKVWETKEFREAKKNFKLDRKCHQCGSKKGVVPHHTISYKSLVFCKLRELAINELCKQRGFTFYPSALRKTGGFSSSGGYIRETELIAFTGYHPEFKDKAKELAKKEYYSFSNIETLCKRCHFEIERGRVLCCICRKRYHPRVFDSCFDCKEAYKKGYDDFERQMDEIEDSLIM